MTVATKKPWSENSTVFLINCDFYVISKKFEYIRIGKSQYIDYFMNKISEQIKARRKEFGLSQSELAALSKVSINTLTGIERGESNPTVGVLTKILSTLGLELSVRVIEL